MILKMVCKKLFTQFFSPKFCCPYSRIKRNPTRFLNMKENNKELIYVNQGLIAVTIFTILPLVGLFLIPNTWWGIIIKIMLILFEIANLKQYFLNPVWAKAKGFTIGVILNILFFSIVWFTWPHWISYVFSIFFLLTLKVMKSALEVPYANHSKK